MFFKKKMAEKGSYDPQKEKPVLRCSICTGEQTAGFEDLRTGQFKDVMLIRSPGDLRDFKESYGITGDIEKIY